MVTELASNALRHGRPPAVVRLLQADGCFIVDVADGDVRSAPKLAAARHVDDGGRGLHIAHSLAIEVCWYATEQAKHIWASFPVEPSLLADPSSTAGPADPEGSRRPAAPMQREDSTDPVGFEGL